MAIGIVVDTSVARAAGRGTQAVEALDAMRKAGLFVVLSPALMEEWQKLRPDSTVPYRSTYAAIWLSSMIARKQWRKRDPEERPLIEAADAIDNEASRREVMKDVHILALVLADDRRLLTTDGALREHLRGIVGTVPDLLRVHWADPQDGLALGWLRNGAPDAEAMQLASLLV